MYKSLMILVGRISLTINTVVVVSLFLKIHLILSVSVFSSNSSLFTIHASKSGSPLFTSTLRALTEWFAEKGKRPNILMRNSLKDEKLLEKTTYNSMNCLRVFGFYISILLFMSTASSKLNFKTSRSNAKVPFREFRGRVAMGNGFYWTLG